jgi:hypothetical protein
MQTRAEPGLVCARADAHARAAMFALAEPLHAIDEPPDHAAPSLVRAFPYIGAAQHADGMEATRCWVWRSEGLIAGGLLAIS